MLLAVLECLLVTHAESQRLFFIPARTLAKPEHKTATVNLHFPGAEHAIASLRHLSSPYRLVDVAGIEPTTRWLKANCSTD